MIDNIEVFVQNSIRVRSSAGTIYIDPFRMEQEPEDADYVLITHDHYDHFSPEDIGKVSKQDTVLVVPERMASKAQEISSLVGKIETVAPGEDRQIGSLEFETVLAYNIIKPFHPRSAGWVGYILKTEGKRIYIAGDTDATKEAKQVRCDIALVPIGGTFTMDAGKAAELVNIIRPEVAIPVHYGDLVGKPGDGDVFAANVDDGIRVEFKIRFGDLIIK